jgi:hypothetical protein
MGTTHGAEELGLCSYGCLDQGMPFPLTVQPYSVHTHVPTL